MNEQGRFFFAIPEKSMKSNISVIQWISDDVKFSCVDMLR